jgi:hypothetical protein
MPLGPKTGNDGKQFGALMASTDEYAMFLQIMEDSRLRQLWRLTNR